MHGDSLVRGVDGVEFGGLFAGFADQGLGVVERGDGLEQSGALLVGEGAAVEEFLGSGLGLGQIGAHAEAVAGVLGLSVAVEVAEEHALFTVEDVDDMLGMVACVI